jgi:hypothetical protein
MRDNLHISNIESNLLNDIEFNRLIIKKGDNNINCS